MRRCAEADQMDFPREVANVDLGDISVQIEGESDLTKSVSEGCETRFREAAAVPFSPDDSAQVST